ncbi:hypothetical protein G7077_08610 [Sphingomonas piscis]|uniref:UrcA family protein n=1 Tax=Sphingomonas piscis TaxID=2714943 RepID=A0A6G7YQE0_9SPHN|nr:hypothetical protein [Sphingomonas piscis]QIK78947.1 hypothetical protein G7077_08610 [Sphingomonas piscis]
MQRVAGFGLALIALLVPAAADAQRNRCGDYHRDYKTATAKVADALQKYADCLDNGDPTYDCGSQYAHLRSGQKLLEVSTYNYRNYCRTTGRSRSQLDN